MGSEASLTGIPRFLEAPSSTPKRKSPEASTSAAKRLRLDNSDTQGPSSVVRQLPFSVPGTGEGPLRPTPRPLAPMTKLQQDFAVLIREGLFKAISTELLSFELGALNHLSNSSQQMFEEEAQLRACLEKSLSDKEILRQSLENDNKMLQLRLKEKDVELKKLSDETLTLNSSLLEEKAASINLQKKLKDRETESALLAEKARAFMTKAKVERMSLEQKLASQKALTAQAHERITKLEEEIQSLKHTQTPSPPAMTPSAESSEFLDLINALDSFER